MINVWGKVRIYLKEKESLSVFSPIWGNDNFIPGRKDLGFRLWAENGVWKVKDLYKDGVLMSFADITDNFKNIKSKKHYYKYLQIRNFIRTARGQGLDEPELTNLEKYISKSSQGGGHISLLYNMLLLGSQESSASRLAMWEQDLELKIDKEKWEQKCVKAQTQTVNSRLQLLQYNWLMRTYITPVKLNKIYSNIPDTSFKFNSEKGTLI